MPSRPPSHEQRLREQRPELARAARLAESREDQARRDADPRQVEANRIRHTQQWLDVQALVMREEPLCRTCTAIGVTARATSVDHVIPLVERPDLAYHRSNLQGLCNRCHALKSAAERRRMGRPPSPVAAPQRKNPLGDSEGHR